MVEPIIGQEKCKVQLDVGLYLIFCLYSRGIRSSIVFVCDYIQSFLDCRHETLLDELSNIFRRPEDKEET